MKIQPASLVGNKPKIAVDTSLSAWLLSP